MHQKIIKFIGLGLFLFFLLLLAIFQGWFLSIQKSIQNVFYDDNQASSEIIVVAIDEKSLSENELGALVTWPREYYAKAIDILNNQKAAVIGIDLTFPNKSTHGIKDDELLSSTLKKYKNVVLATRYDVKNGEKTVEFPNDKIMATQPKLGWINVRLDEDNFVRQLPVFSESSKGVIEAFSLAISRVYLNASPVNYRVTDQEFNYSESIQIPVQTQIDPDSKEEVNLMYLNYFAAPNTFRYLSFSDLLKDKLMDSEGGKIDFRDKIVLIGPTAIDLQDNYLSPVSQGVQMPGVEVHANAIQTVITQEFLQDQSRLSFWLMICGLLIINVMIFSFLRVRYALILILVELLGVIIAGILAYEFRILMNVVYPILTILLSFVGCYVLRFILEQRERQFIEGAFSRYVNKTVVNQIRQDPSKLQLGGTKVELTVLFSDIAGFTTISEKFKPEELVSFLNEYLGEMTDIIMKKQGTLDKYEGDAIMAFWNAPLPQHDHALHACLAALENQERLAQLRKKWEREGMPEMKVRIGINTGVAVVGNMGSKNRFNYTAVSDDVNLASRLEGINKQYGTYLIISEATHLEVKDHFICRELDEIRVKGKSKSVKIYELICKKVEETPELKEKMATFEEGLNLYRKQQFKEAKMKFEIVKNDSPAKVFIARCEAFIKTPPGPKWDGVWNFEVK